MIQPVTSSAQPRFSPDRAIEIQALSHSYNRGRLEVLKDINLNFGTGFFGLLGANGAGKSTLMRILCTILKPTQGVVRVHGHDVTKKILQVRALLGYLPQTFGAWRLHRTEEVLDTLARLSGMRDRAHRKARVEEVLELVGLSDVADRKVKKLSGGMVRRLGVAQALVHEPQVIIVDEPTVGLDPEERMRFRQLMTRLGTDRTILLSTHIVADLGGGCQEIAILDEGQVVFQDSPSALLSEAEGTVFTATVEHRGAPLIEAAFEIVSRIPRGSEMQIRFVSDGNQALPDGAEQVDKPSLEEAYLAFMLKRGRAEAARENQETNPPAEQPKAA